MMDPDIPSQAELIRNAVLLMLDLHEHPATAVQQLLDGRIRVYDHRSQDAETAVTA